MSNPEFGAYLSEYETEGIGMLLYSLILDVVRRTIHRYPPMVYSPNQVWDEDAVTGVCHDFTLERLLKDGHLAHHFLTHTTVGGLAKALALDVRHFLISRKKRSELSNLFGRTREILQTDPRFKVHRAYSKAAVSSWGLDEWTEERSVAQRLDEIVGAMFAVELPSLVRYRADSKKLSHLIGTDDLARLLVLTFRAVGKYISLGLLIEGLRHRLGLLETDTISLDEPIYVADQGEVRTYFDVVPDSTNVETEASVLQTAEEVFERLTNRQRRVLALRLSMCNPTLEEIGECLGVSKSTVHNDLVAIGQHIAAMDVTQEEVEVVLGYLSEICVRRRDSTSGPADEFQTS